MTRLEKVTHILLIMVCCVSLSMLIERRLGQINHAQPTHGAIGAVFPLRGVHWGDAKTNVVLFVRSGCHFCEASLPFFRQLVQVKKTNHDVRLLVATTDTPAVARKFLAAGGVDVDEVYQNRLDGLDVKGTPAVFIIDSRGRVTEEFAGKLPPAKEHRLLAAISPHTSGQNSKQ